MGIRSQVGFCVAPGIEVPRFEDIEPNWEFDKVIRDERGTLYFVDEVKWYDFDDREGNGVVSKVGTFLASLNAEDYLFIEMYPGDGYGMETEISGWWSNNDFGLGYISRVCYEDETK